MVGERLLDRATRHFALTEAGERHIPTLRAILDNVSSLRPTTRSTVIGSIAVTAPELFGRLHVLPVIESFQAAHPDAQVRLLLLNRIVDLTSEGVDAAIRLAALPDSSLTAIKLGSVRRLTCAAPSYLAQCSLPLRPADLADHRCIGLNDAGAQELWPYRDPAAGRRVRSIRVTCGLSTNSAAASIEAAERGAGVIRPLSYQVQRQIDDGSLVTLLRDHEPAPLPVHLVFRATSASHGILRAFVNHAAPLMRRSIRVQAEDDADDRQP